MLKHATVQQNGKWTSTFVFRALKALLYYKPHSHSHMFIQELFSISYRPSPYTAYTLCHIMLFSVHPSTQKAKSSQKRKVQMKI